jgi:hypothetical protein
LFSAPLTQLSFTRVTVGAKTSLPPWSAFAYDASDSLLSSVIEPSIFPGPPAETFTLTGPRISRIHIEAFNSGGMTFNHPPFDDVALTVPTDVPEPASLLLLGSGLAAAAARHRARKRT